MSSPDAQPVRFPGAVRLFRLKGINVFLHWSWAVVAVLAIQMRDDAYASRLWNVAEYVGLFGIVLLHEFGHALACRSVGGKADRILLWPLGGIAYVRPPRRPGALLWSIAAGPLVNVALIPVMVGLILFLSSFEVRVSADFERFLFTMATINLVLLVFNMLPIYPLDGGQIVQAVLWFFLGQHRSLTVAAAIGLAGAAGVMVLALSRSDLWLIILAIFGASRSWQGLREAKALARLLRLPRHAGLRCPACHAAPPVGAFWRCECGVLFDGFSSSACCPHCGAHYATAPCLLCGEANSVPAWWPAPKPVAMANTAPQD